MENLIWLQFWFLKEEIGLFLQMFNVSMAAKSPSIINSSSSISITYQCPQAGEISF